MKPAKTYYQNNFSPRNSKSVSIIFSLFAFGFSFLNFAPETSAQKKFTKTYAVGTKNVRLQIANRSGSITVEGWQRNEIRVLARMETPVAKVTPVLSNGTLSINVVRDNYGKNDIGSVNFDIKVPNSAAVDIETRIGNLTIKDVNGSSARAHVTAEGDITLTDISADSVMAENIIGDIFFDGELQKSGTYQFSSTRGNINLRIPLNSSFKLVATAPSSRQISLGSFANAGLNLVSDGRRVVGSVNGGNSSLTVTNQRGSISFVRR